MRVRLLKWQSKWVVGIITMKTLKERERNNNKTSLSFHFILMSTLTWITGKELEFEINNNGVQFRRKGNMKIIENEKCWRRPRWKWGAVKETEWTGTETFSPNKLLMYKKRSCTCKVVLLLIKCIVVFIILVTTSSPCLQYYSILYFLWGNYKY